MCHSLKNMVLLLFWAGNSLLNCQLLRGEGLGFLLLVSQAEPIADFGIQGAISVNNRCSELIDGKGGDKSKVTQREWMAKPGQGSSDFQSFPLDK